MKGMTEAERFWAKVEKTDSCWTWRGGRCRGGYGQFKIRGRQTKAHRWSYLQLVGPIPDGLELDHLCRVTYCVRPSHLEAVTHQENMRRSDTRGAIAGRTNQCGYGHSLVDAYHIPRSNRRNCRTCNRAAQQRRRARQAAVREKTVTS